MVNKPDANSKKVLVGEKGRFPTTHCYVSKKALKGHPVNYSLGGLKYVSVNSGFQLSYADIEEIKKRELKQPEVAHRKEKLLEKENE